MPNPEHAGFSQWMGEGHLTERMVEISRDQGIAAAMQYYLDSLNLVPKYTRNEGANFAFSRERLATKPGLVIANHPGDFDNPSILSQIHRRDLKILVDRKRLEELRIFGPDLFLPAAKSPGPLREVLRQTEEHIDQGGLTVIYPTGGQKSPDKSNRGFQSGFRAIVQRLKPEDMIYSFYIDPKDVAQARSQMPQGSVQRLEQPQEIKIDEAYSEAAEWQEIIARTPKAEVNDELTKHFLSKFNRERFD